MRKIMASSTALALFLYFGGAAMGAEYEITVDMDETTNGDFEMVETFLESANNESVPSMSLRRVLMGGTGELAASVDARFDSAGNLTLDDGSLVQFLDEDLLKVRKKLCSKRLLNGNCGNANIDFRCKRSGPSVFHRKCQPESVRVCPEAGGSIRLLVPPGNTKGGIRVCTPNDTNCLKEKCIHN